MPWQAVRIRKQCSLNTRSFLIPFDSGATTKITINNRRLNKADFEQTILIPMADDGLDKYRKEYNKMLLDKATGANSIVQDKYVTVSVCKKNIEEARNYFARVGADLIAHFNRLGSKCGTGRRRQAAYLPRLLPYRRRNSVPLRYYPDDAERSPISRILSALIPLNLRATTSEWVTDMGV